MRDTDSPQWLTACDLMEPLGLLHGNDVAVVDNWTCTPIAGGVGEVSIVLPSLEPTMPGEA